MMIQKRYEPSNRLTPWGALVFVAGIVASVFAYYLHLAEEPPRECVCDNGPALETMARQLRESEARLRAEHVAIAASVSALDRDMLPECRR